MIKPAGSSLRIIRCPGGRLRIPGPAAPGGFDYPATLRGATPHFQVYYSPSLGADGPTIADGVLATCEQDYTTMSGWFGGLPVGPFNVIIAPGIPGAYHHSCSASDIYCGAVTKPAADVDFTRLVLVAEAVEVFSAIQGKGWVCSQSNGEGLSRVLAFALHPPQEPGLTTAASWLESPRRPNYVNRNSPTDRSAVANGCSVLFLNYLHDQLGFGWDHIVQAAGPTLAATYSQLTQRTDAWPRFSALLQAHFPLHQTSGLTTDNPFPL